MQPQNITFGDEKVVTKFARNTYLSDKVCLALSFYILEGINWLCNIIMQVANINETMSLEESRLMQMVEASVPKHELMEQEKIFRKS